MRLNLLSSRMAPLFWGFCIVACSALFGYWKSEDSPVRSSVSPKPKTTTAAESQVPYDQIELTLAQAGCPGWMVLAEEGEAAFQPSSASSPNKSHSGEVQQTAFRVAANTPYSSSPTTARVANRFLFEPPRRLNAQLTTSPTDAPNDLLDGVPDLLAAPAEPQQPPTANETPANPPKPVALPQTDDEPATGPSLGVESVRPAPAPVTPRPVEMPATERPIERKPVSREAKPAPTLPPRAPVQVQPRPRIEAPQPRTENPVTIPVRPAQPKQQLRLQPQPTPRTQPAPRQTITPEQLPTATPAPVATPVSPAEQIPAPKPQQVIPAPQPSQPRPKPQQSPFAPPPQPQQPTPHSVGPHANNSAANTKQDGESKTYCEYVAEQQYPSAFVCAKCHQKIFDEWSISSHAYAAISPMFHKFEQTINDLSQGTVGYFCYRCHVPVGTNMGLSRAAPLWDLPQVAREGVTCIACHRVNQRYGKVNGHRRIEPGGIHDKVYGSIGGGGIAEVIAQKDKYKVKTSPHDKGPGQDIHVAGESFDQLGKSEFCVSCHQVAVHPGIKLEVVWEQYRASPACKKGVSCQDCHMGRLPGVPSGYEYGAAAEISGKAVNKNRKHANHVFYGPGYSIAHPGVFPHNKDALRWPMPDWLVFNWRAGWGTDDFEEALEDGKIHANFPKVWAEADDRYDARDIIEDNLKKLQVKKLSRQQTMENGSHVDGPYFDTPLVRGEKMKFHYIMTNTNEGHNLPSGSLGAQPQLWANVVLVGPRGQRLWESGYTDSYGDVADIHSVDVRNKRIPYDWQLFNLQTMFLITGAKGTDREFFLPVNFDIDQLPYLRPGAQPVSVLNHPPFIRMEGRSLAPLGSRKIPYQIPKELMREPGHYRLSFRLRSRAEPIYFMRFCGSTKEMNRMMNEWIVDFHESSVEFFVK